MIAILPKARVPRLSDDPSEREKTKVPGANVLKDGFLTPIPRVPEDVANVRDEATQWFYSLSPRNEFHAWIVQDIALCTLRLERVARIERRERDRVALRAAKFWDDDRRIEAEELGQRLARDPSSVLKALRKTPQGCDWLMTRWAMLARVADRDGAWDEGQTALAYDLLGTPSAFRKGTPGETVDHQGRPEAASGADLVALARGQVEGLMQSRDQVVDADALDRSLAMSDMADATSPELRRLRRYEATLHKRLRWNLHQLQQVPKFAQPHPNLKYHFEPEPEPEVETPEASPAPIAPEPEPDAENASNENGASLDSAPIPAPRRDPVKLRAEAKRAARKDKKDRLRN